MCIRLLKKVELKLNVCIRLFKKVELKLNTGLYNVLINEPLTQLDYSNEAVSFSLKSDAQNNRVNV